MWAFFMEYQKVAAVQGFKIKLNETIEYSAMPHETEILANESGIQYQGVNDASSVTGEYPIQGLMTGIFKRGRFDRPMTIHKSNIKAMLGHEPKNPYYNAVQDALETGVPSVQVLRLKGANTSIISCEGATNSVSFAVAMDQYGFDNIKTAEIQNALQIILDGAVLDSYVEPSAVGLKLEASVETDVTFQIENGFVVQSVIKYSNISELPKRLEIKSATKHVKFYMWANPTVNQIDGNTRNHVGACLSAKTESQNDDGVIQFYLASAT